jgi:hypothetical protein
MDKRLRFSHVEAIEFTLSCSDVMELLAKAGHIPEGFMLDCDNPEATDWPVKLHVKRIADSALQQSTGESK